MNRPFLDQVVAVWAAQNVPGARCEVKRAPHNPSLIIEIEGSRVLATIEAWEAAECLDTTTLDLATKLATIHSAGPTKSTQEMQRRLVALSEIIRAYEVPNAV